MRSLRGRLGALVAAGLFLVILGAGVGIVFERWQEEQANLSSDVEIAAFRLSETSDPTNPSVSVGRGADAYAVTFDSEAEVLGSTRQLSDELLEDLIAEVWAVTTTAEEVFVMDFGNDQAATMTVAGVRCVDQNRCDTAIVGVSEEPFASYAIGRLGWVVGLALLAAVLGLAAARWLVTRSLRPVEEMRSELDRITETDLGRRVPVPASGDELQRLGASMNATISRLGAAVSANERFVADAAHELRSPITGVRAALEVESAKKPSGLLDDSMAELDRASRLVDDLLVLARRQGGPSATGDIDLDDLARSSVAGLRARRPDIDIDIELAPCRVRGNADDIQRIVTNLLDNAERYGAARIFVATGQNQAGAVLQIDDDGPGVPLADRSVIFERFARLDESRSTATGGSGLGLAIAKELAEDHGGSITVSEAALGGASFELRLPA